MEVEVHGMLRCPACWGSHGCGRTRGHEGDHACNGENGCDMQVGQDGTDEHGFKWDLYGDEPWDSQPQSP